ncbi:prenyltransferase/squalene oxidase repeat-containing protein [Streptomyces justiciae]|uniref:prenyltransferase/squalene oxidase repeat-containing protein n=1 Tax=Streptomyces justiciae TaxID=2780140 RepID=UPI002119B164|nr:prenyltransferase/squalene oxidase repeat-containing protein [Streptomyces justiciae]MCW8382690.1 terpene cyclase/mutase family protein [Streptomyces justiciae]
MNVRRSAAVLAATAVIGTAAPAVAADPSTSPSPSVVLPEGLYGAGDPTYDGVWRQSLALIAQHRADVRPAAKAVDWLAGQQCANGSFAPFRSDPAKACDSKTLVDTNSTAAAVQALSALGEHQAVVDKAETWLRSWQNKDGGWGYTPGGPSDANSTAVVIGALSATGLDPAKDVLRNGHSPYDALLDLALPCADGGGFAYQPDKKGKLAVNADATAAAVVGAAGLNMVTAQADDRGKGDCADGPADPEQAATNGAAYLAKAVRKDGYLKSALPGSEDQPDYGNTADAVVALAVRDGASAAREPLAWLEKNSAAWAKQSGPAAYAQLIIAAETAGADPRDFGGTDLVKELNALGPAPRKPATAAKADKDDDGSGNAVWWTVLAGLAAGAGVGMLLSGRNRKRHQ